MAYCEANGIPVAEGRFALPRQGRGVAELRLGVLASDAPIGMGASAELTFQDGSSYAMTCLRSGPDKGAWRVLLAQGAGRLSTLVQAKFYKDIPRRTVVLDLLGEVGEVAGEVALEGQFAFWARLNQEAHHALDCALLSSPQHTWFLDSSGRVCVTSEAPTAYQGELIKITEHGGAGRLLLEGVPDLTPRFSVDGRPLARVVHLIGGGPRTEAYFK